MTDGLNARIKPGTRAKYHGIDVVAANNDVFSCADCPFRNLPEGNGRCEEVPCGGVTWVPALTYITHRLTS